MTPAYDSVLESIALSLLYTKKTVWIFSITSSKCSFHYNLPTVQEEYLDFYNK